MTPINFTRLLLGPGDPIPSSRGGLGSKIKKIQAKPHARLSLQSHTHRSEHWVVVEGKACKMNGETFVSLLANQSAFIPAGQKHRLENLTDQNSIMIEVQCGKYLGEDDIERFDDVYGR
jgi:mannose-6-phosphate isomerase-like protein (cupin superfamily)